MYNNLVEYVNNIDASRFVLKTKYDADTSDLEKKTPDASRLVKKTDYSAKITQIESKIPSISCLDTNTALTAFKNKIPDVNSFVKKTDYNTKIGEIEKKLTDHNHDKYITTPKCNKLIAENFSARLARANLVTKADFDDETKKPQS